MKNFTILGLAVGLAVAGSANAEGVGSTGGGNAVVCYDKSNEIVSARLLDFYEGIHVFGDKPDLPSGWSFKEKLDNALNRLARTGYSLHLPNVVELKKATEIVLKHQKFIPETDRLKPVGDSYEGVIPQGCKVEQAAVFFDEDNIVFDHRIWDHLQEDNKVGLVLHEAVYWFNRLNNAEFDSRRSRRVVSLSLLEGWNFENATDGLPKSYAICRSMASENGRYFKPTVFAVFKEGGINVLQFFSLGGDFALSKKTAYLPGQFPFIDDLEDKSSYGSDLVTNSRYEGNDTLRLEREPVFNEKGDVVSQKITMRGQKPSYPQRTIDEVQIRCSLINQ